MNYLVSGTESGVAVFPMDSVERLARDRWNGAVDYSGFPPDGTFTIGIKKANEPYFSIRFEANGESLSTDGTDDQIAEVAVWARNLLPETLDGEVWLYDQALSAHRVLEPSMSESEVWADWIEN